MKRSNFKRLFTVFFALMLMAVSFSGCRMNLPDTSGIGPDAAGNKGSETQAAEGGEDAAAALEGAGETGDSSEEKDGIDMLLDATEDENSDVTAGTVEDGYYTMTALLNDETSFNVDAVEAVLKDKGASKAADAKDKAGDLNKARLAYLTAYYEGDAASAKEDLDEYEKGNVSSAEMDAIRAFYPEIGKVFAQFDITSYDFTAPTDADESFVSYDVFSSANEPFTLDFTFDEGTLTDISMSYDGDLE